MMTMRDEVGRGHTYLHAVGRGRRHATVDLVVPRRLADDIIVEAAAASGLDGAGRLGRSDERRRHRDRRNTARDGTSEETKRQRDPGLGTTHARLVELSNSHGRTLATRPTTALSADLRLSRELLPSNTRSRCNRFFCR